MEKEIIEVKPHVIYSKCVLENGKQSDCRTCNNKDVCILYQPRCMCLKPYPGHPDGCPNYGKPGCPPNTPMYDQVFDMDEPIYAIVTNYDLEEYFNQRRKNRPDLPEGQIRNSRCWQPRTKKENDYAVRDFLNKLNRKDYVATRLLESMGVDVIGTMKEIGLEIKFPVIDHVYRVSFAAKAREMPLQEYNTEIYEEEKGIKKGLRTLVKKK